MPKAAAKKTALVLKYKRFALALIGLIFAAFVNGLVHDLKLGPYTTPAMLGKVQLQLDVASTNEKRIRGLSGRTSLGQNQGMLFVFNDSQAGCMWMKDMLIPLDVLWFDKNYSLVQTAQNLSPDSYPQLFCSDQPAQYFLEVPAGFVAKHSIQIGTELTLQ